MVLELIIHALMQIKKGAGLFRTPADESGLSTPTLTVAPLPQAASNVD